MGGPRLVQRGGGFPSMISLTMYSAFAIGGEGVEADSGEDNLHVGVVSHHRLDSLNVSNNLPKEKKEPPPPPTYLNPSVPLPAPVILCGAENLSPYADALVDVDFFPQVYNQRGC